MLYQVPGSAGLGQNIGSLPHTGDVLPFNAYNSGVGGRRKFGCLNYEFVSSKNNPGIKPDMVTEGSIIFPNETVMMEYYKANWPTLGEKFYAFDGGYGGTYFSECDSSYRR